MQFYEQFHQPLCIEQEPKVKGDGVETLDSTSRTFGRDGLVVPGLIDDPKHERFGELCKLTSNLLITLSDVNVNLDDGQDQGSVSVAIETTPVKIDHIDGHSEQDKNNRAHEHCKSTSSSICQKLTSI